MSPGSVTYEIPHASRWGKLLVGFGLNGALVVALAIANPQFFVVVSRPVVLRDYSVTLVAPTSLPGPEPQPRRVISAPVQLARTEVAKLPPPPETKPIPGAPKEDSLANSAAPSISSTVRSSLPAKPAPDKKAIRTDVFNAASSEAITHHPSREVQTGGFGDPNGIPVESAPNNSKATLTAARVGAFDLPSDSGRGNGADGSHGTSGILRSAGFAGAVATQPANETRTVQTGGFGTVVSNPAPLSARQVPTKPSLQPVEITYKPRPAYTSEARRQKIEGEVLLDVVFTASGSLRINRVVKALGYGLDDMALAAARNIQFHPAERDGQPYDCAALVHIVFELPK